MFHFWDAVVFIFSVAYALPKGARLAHIRYSAWRIGLRDKGEAEDRSACIECHTRARIGIDTETQEPHHYCWRCEHTLNVEDPDPKGREDIPVEPSGKVVQLHGRRDAA